MHAGAPARQCTLVIIDHELPDKCRAAGFGCRTAGLAESGMILFMELCSKIL